MIDALRQSPEITRADVADRTGLSRATVSALVRDLERDGLVEVVAGTANGTRTGRRPEVLRLTRRAGAVLGVDFGHEHVRVAVGDLAGRTLSTHQEPVDVDHGMDAALAAARRLADRAIAESGIRPTDVIACGAGVPGPVDRLSGRIGSTMMLPGWSGTTLAVALEAQLGVPVVVDNDANLGALGEQTAGAAVGIDDVIYVKVSSGVGAGLISGGNVLHGGTGIAGEIGHVAVVPNGVPCRCGGRGCLETVASAPAVRRQLHATAGDEIPADDLVAALATGDPRVARLLADAGRALGRVLASACHLLDPSAIVLGGDPAFATDPVLAGVREELDRHRLPGSGSGVQLVPARLGDLGQVVGALRLAAALPDRRIPIVPHDQQPVPPGGGAT
ncbi:Putative ROK-family transcriptional regulator [Patulibacter medicamentivorans]|uniref:Putative ROK-family transcriptional regulator n=1 Tax=Patulibacter medicamentivorans TaxID=1097667 RepID=H0E635_9ACTN|nr:ROK family transcriptional regulator [Patulibacter medicamentivorans]EHN10864.1 Putative ROK-family transcriptional regulator [Patulibacter medicamentivorans]